MSDDPRVFFVFVRKQRAKRLVSKIEIDNNRKHTGHRKRKGSTRPAAAHDNSHNMYLSLSGQCVLSTSSRSLLNPSFDLSLCRAGLEANGFQIPVGDMEAPLRAALDVPSVRRYMVFNSAFFHFVMAPVLYMVVWCVVFSTLHLYITVSDYWVLCLCVSLVSIFLTTAIIFVLHQSNKEINMNLDVRLIQVNERMVKHKLLVAVADWVQNCTGNMQLYFVYWDMAHCLRALTETLEERSFVANDIQVSESSTSIAPVGPRLRTEVRIIQSMSPFTTRKNCAPSSQREGAKVTETYSLIPDTSLPAQAKAYQLLMTYSAVYVRLLVCERFSGPSHHRLRSRRTHCTVAPLCLCQYIKKKILQ
ncbi:putative transmembrane protein C9orf91 -like [Scophthalmus maximus]|uniref:Putative transmembrane protein C9orf91-like n=1 Tax=Scophthalmus maximus TaxID=52904 RepID=A0A2U9CZ99_SCOMX|nr:putative transmembrane protein C9orf91 -like [Scophthalmus maximus]